MLKGLCKKMDGGEAAGSMVMPSNTNNSQHVTCGYL